MTFIVRLYVDEAGRIAGVVERVKTGEKERVYGTEAISHVVARMVSEGGGPGPVALEPPPARA